MYSSAPRCVQDVGNFRDARFENAQRGGIGDHQCRDVVGDEFAQFLHVNLAMRFGLDVLDLVAGNHCRGRIRAVRGIWNQNFFACVALLFQIRANQQQAGQFSLRAGCGLQRDGVHPGDFQQAVFQQLDDFQAALRKLLRLVGMFGSDAIQARHEFVHPRIVFHRARAQRVHAEINGVIPGGKPREVPQHFDLAYFRETGHAVLAMIRRRAISRRPPRGRPAEAIRTPVFQARIFRR